MKRKLYALLLAGALVGGTATVSAAHHREGHDANHYGLCTALANMPDHAKGSENGRAFQQFADEVEDGVCDDATPGGSRGPQGSQEGGNRPS